MLRRQAAVYYTLCSQVSVAFEHPTAPRLHGMHTWRAHSMHCTAVVGFIHAQLACKWLACRSRLGHAACVHGNIPTYRIWQLLHQELSVVQVVIIILNRHGAIHVLELIAAGPGGHFLARAFSGPGLYHFTWDLAQDTTQRDFYWINPETEGMSWAIIKRNPTE